MGWESRLKRGRARVRDWIVCALALPLLASASAHAYNLEPRAYSNIPVGMNFVLAGYAYAEGGVSVDPSIPLEDAELDSHAFVLAGARSFGLAGQSGLLSAFLPYADLSGSAVFAGRLGSRSVEGLADPMVRISWNLHGAPAMNMEQYLDYEQDTILGLSLLVSLPLGDYDPDKLLNIGANRWTFRPELGASKKWGNWVLETAVAATYYTDNDDYFGGQRLEQDPIYSFQGHLGYIFTRGLWASLGTTYYTGGRTRVGGNRRADLQQNWRTGATIAVPLSSRHSLKGYVSTGVQTRTGNDFDLYGLVWQYRWGDGM